MSKGPWKRKNAMVADALRDPGDPEIDLTEEEVNAIVEPVAEPIPEPPVVAAPAMPSAPIAMTLEQLQALLAANSASTQQNTQALADALTQGIKQAQPQRPSNEIAPDVSDANPLGERDHPRPGLKCKITLGIMDPKSRQIQPTYPFVAEDLTAYEQIALNTLSKGEYQVKLYDGRPIKVQVVEEFDALDRLQRMVVIVPQHVTQKGSETRNMLPGPLALVQQMSGTDYSRLSLDDLAWFMAEHRAGRYVSERVAVAA